MSIKLIKMNIHLTIPEKNNEKIILDKHLLLFGDVHTPLDEKIPKKNEIPTPVFFKNLMEYINDDKTTTNKCIDFWIENFIDRTSKLYATKQYDYQNMLQKFIYTIPRESEYKIDTLNIMRKFFYNCHPNRSKLFKNTKHLCNFGSKRLRVHDFDTRFKHYNN